VRLAGTWKEERPCRSARVRPNQRPPDGSVIRAIAEEPNCELVVGTAGGKVGLEVWARRPNPTAMNVFGLLVRTITDQVSEPRTAMGRGTINRQQEGAE